MSHNFNQGVRFGPFHSRQDWGLILESDDIGFPVATGIADDYGAYGLPEFDPKVTWSNRVLTFNFGIAGIEDRWPALVTTITNALQGKKLQIIRDCEPNVCYIGRCHVEAFRKELRIGHFVITVNAEPYKQVVIPTTYIPTGTRYTINYDGAYPAPCVVRVAPTGAIATFTIGGLAHNPLTLAPEDIVIKGLKNDVPVIIDGIKKTITENGANKYAEATIWNFPMLVPGQNVLTFSHTTQVTRVQVYKRYI